MIKVCVCVFYVLCVKQVVLGVDFSCFGLYVYSRRVRSQRLLGKVAYIYIGIGGQGF